MDRETLDLIALAQTGAAELADLPWGAHAIAGAGVLVGVALLLVGRKLLRAGIVLAAAVLGGATAFYAAPSLGLAVDPNIMLAVGLAAGAIAGVTLYRVTISVTFMALLAAAGPLVAAGVMRLAATETLPAETHAAGAAALSAPDETPGSLDAAAEEAWERVRAFTGSVRDAASREWDALEREERSVLLGSAMLGAAAGLLLGAMFHKRVAAIMSAFLGAALLLPSAAWLLEAYVPGAGERLPARASVWLALWAGLSVVGAAVQWTGGKKRADS